MNETTAELPPVNRQTDFWKKAEAFENKAYELVQRVFDRWDRTPDKIVAAIHEKVSDSEQLDQRFRDEITKAQEKLEMKYSIAGALIGSGIRAAEVVKDTLEGKPYQGFAPGTPDFYKDMISWVGGAFAGAVAAKEVGKVKASRDIKEFCKSELGIDIDKSEDVWAV